MLVFFVALGVYLAVLAALTLLILNGRIQSESEAVAVSALVCAPALLVFLIFYSTSPILWTLDHEWRYKEFGAAYALATVVTALLTASLIERPEVFSLVVAVLALAATALPSLRRFLVRIARSFKVVVAAGLLFLGPGTQGFAQTLRQSTGLPFSLVRLETHKDH
ncbi:hypothetical protein BOO71_0000709 [Deinococcus marmoris]|uniref:Uncharacterized protein n=2 Tax=Deinococcus marmoris TaxID=249408 RepID=A0A1U7P4X6_9DEIO|nr:hypothetical protein BOO71_0000709 [Deinococcus marmoris]